MDFSCCSQDGKYIINGHLPVPYAGLNLKKELPLLINHWDSIRSNDNNSTQDFRYVAYNIVATLIEYLLCYFSSYFVDTNFTNILISSY